MTTKIADDYEYIRARMEEIKAERNAIPTEAPTKQYLDGEAKEPTTYMGWDIYPPHIDQGHGLK